MQWQEVVEFLGGATVFGAVMAYLGKTAVDAYVSGRVESYKSELQRVAAEHSIRFQRLHAERAEVIKDFYARFVHLDENLYSTLREFQQVGEPPLEDKAKLLANEFNEIRSYFLPRRIFLEESLCELIDTALEKTKGIYFDLTTYELDPRHTDYAVNPELRKERTSLWEQARGVYKNEFKEIKLRLEKEFRAILGLADA